MKSKMQIVRQLLGTIILALLLPVDGNAFVCNPDSVEKIEVYSSYRVFSPVPYTRYSWVENISNWEKIVITNKKTQSQIIDSFCHANKIFDLGYDVYNPEVSLDIYDNLTETVYYPKKLSVDGMMIIYAKGRRPEVLWLGIHSFDRERECYQMPDNFWELLYPDSIHPISGE
ncbi:hypothetical protein [Muribaculum intestinale]|jgi:hypothetical protein|uniref:hypothetical protein n=1 Tax=Muribaculum intestinale TaxID=1796646 RepID=UPI000F465E65|nr:hypothetical protein [Muribaculum intestinale]RXE63568.1 hypothetical protein ED388_14990 [Muribaculaceae bacterium Isolate-007 (NCI)]